MSKFTKDIFCSQCGGIRPAVVEVEDHEIESMVRILYGVGGRSFVYAYSYRCSICNKFHYYLGSEVVGFEKEDFRGDYEGAEDEFREYCRIEGRPK